MKRTISTFVLGVFALVCLIATAQPSQAQDVRELSLGLVFKTDRAIPVMPATLWSDGALKFLGGTPSLDGLLGYDPAPASQQVMVGYQAVLNWKLTEMTGFYFGMAYLGAIGEVRFEHLWERLGIAAGVRVAIK